MDQPKTTHRFASLNVRSAVTDHIKFVVSSYFSQINVDLAFVQETLLPGRIENQEWGNEYVFSGMGPPPKSNPPRGGVGFVYHPSRITLVPRTLGCFSNRIVCAKFLPKDGISAPFIAVSVYSPTESASDQDLLDFYIDLSTTLTELRHVYKNLFIYIAGDFNCNFGKDALKSARVRYVTAEAPEVSSRNAKSVLEFAESYSLVIHNLDWSIPDFKRVTWVHPRTKAAHIKDLLLTSRNCRAQVKTFTSLRMLNKMDHKAIFWVLNVNHPRFKKLQAPPARRQQPTPIRDTEPGRKPP